MIYSTKRFLSASLLAVAIGAGLATTSNTASAQGAEPQYFPLLTYRTGPYGVNGAPWANGFVDYLKLVNNRDGGINGVKISWEECEFGYATDRGVECYERIKGKGKAASVQPLSTGVTFALTDKVEKDQIPILTVGYGRSESQDGRVFKWNFPIGGSYWTAADIIIQHLIKKEGDLKGKKIALIYHDSPYGKEPIPLLQKRAQLNGFQFTAIPVAHPGVEQKSAWLQVRQTRPDYVLLWGWGVMNGTAIKEAVATNYPREKMYGIWWAGAEVDVKDVGANAKGYNAITLQHGAGRAKVHEEILKHVHGKGQGTGPADEVGTVLYTRGMISGMLAVEGVRTAQGKYGKKALTGAQTRWGYENLYLDHQDLANLGFANVLRAIKTTCDDHVGSTFARIHTWDGTKWNFTSDWYSADDSVVNPLVRSTADAYAKSKNIQRRPDADCRG